MPRQQQDSETDSSYDANINQWADTDTDAKADADVDSGKQLSLLGI